MAAFNCNEIQKFLEENGGKVTNKDLVKHFREFLAGPESLPDAKNIFKEYVNTVGNIKVEEGIKYIYLKKRVHRDASGSSSPHTSHIENELKKVKLDDVQDATPPLLHSHSSPACFPSEMDYLALPSFGAQAPQPPPRRKHSTKGKENRGAKHEERKNQENIGKDSNPISPGSVRERALRLNKMASETDQVATPRGYRQSGRTRNKDDKPGEDDAASISSIDPIRKLWILSSSRADYHELVRLLKQEARLAGVKDHNKYSALHWAAKHGNLDVVKLMAGTYGLDPNARTSGGYTALHLAAICGREEIMEVLINTYGADPKIRDYSGKRPHQYLSPSQSERFLTLFPELRVPQFHGKLVAGQLKGDNGGFTRMGSLNSKKKLSAGGRAIHRMKSWGSADNIPDRDLMLMPPPKTFPKKKKSRKHTDIIGLSDNWRGRTGDSDSDSASGLAS